MGFLTAVERLSLRARPMPEQGTTARLARSLPPVAPIERPHVDLDSVAGNFIACIRRGTQPSLRDWNRIAWCLWTTKPAVAEDDRALDAMLNRVVDMVRNKKRRPYRQLASAYLTDFAIDRPKLAQISGVLRDFASAAGEPWDKLQARYALFTGAEAVGRIARLALKEQTNIQGLLKPAGVRGMLLEAGFAEAVHDKGLEILRSTPVHTAVERIDTVRRWSLDEERLIFKRCKGQLARAVVLPFGERIPALAERNEILNFLIARFGDPRISGGEWIGLDDVVDILRRWLIEQSLRQFLDVWTKSRPTTCGNTGGLSGRPTMRKSCCRTPGSSSAMKEPWRRGERSERMSPSEGLDPAAEDKLSLDMPSCCWTSANASSPIGATMDVVTSGRNQTGIARNSTPLTTRLMRSCVRCRRTTVPNPI